MNPIRTAVVGVGYLGRFHAQKYKALEGSGRIELVCVCDNSESRAQEIGNEIGVRAEKDYRKLVGLVDAVSIAAATPAHYEVGLFFLQNNIHVFMEKPIASTVAQAEELVAQSEDRELVFQVGHIERFNPAFRRATEFVTSPVAVDFQRLAPFGPRSNATVDVVVDLMIHDLDLALSLDPSPIRSMSAWGWSLTTKLTDIAIAHLTFESGMIASFTSSRVAPSLVRRMNLVQEGATMAVDFAQNVFEIGQYSKQTAPQVQSQKFEKADPLLGEVEAFLNSIQKKQKASVSGRAGLEALRLAEKIVEVIGASKE